jgi:hypothetical protein
MRGERRGRGAKRRWERETDIEEACPGDEVRDETVLLAFLYQLPSVLET